jgi:hypothetical protein
VLAPVLQPPLAAGAEVRLNAQVDKAAWVRQLPSYPIYRRMLAGLHGARATEARERLAQWAEQLAREPLASGSLTGPNARAVLEAAARATPPWENGDLWAIARPDATLTQAAGGGDPIAHVGFVLRTDAGWVLRSASLQDRGVSDVPIASALRTTPKQGGVLGVAMGRLLPNRG